MRRMTTGDFPPEVIRLFQGYIHGELTRRQFLDGAARFATAGFTAVAMLEALRPNYAWAEQVAKDDPRIQAARVEYPSPQGSGTMRGYLARPAGGGGRGCIAVIHENRGLSPYIEDVARRLAAAGYVALAPDALTPLGGFPGDDEKAARMFSQLDPKKRTEDLLAAIPYLRSRPECSGKLGAMGFCFGGGIANLMAVRIPDLAAAVPFYGAQPSAADTARIKAALCIHYAGNDEHIDAGWPAWEKALRENGVRYEEYMYPGTYHGFHNDTTPRYDEAAAKLAWSRTLAFLQKHLSG